MAIFGKGVDLENFEVTEDQKKNFTGADFEKVKKALSQDKSVSASVRDAFQTYAKEQGLSTVIVPEDKFDLAEFDDLLGKLEESKMTQQRQRSVEGRRDIYAQGLASMMGNF